MKKILSCLLAMVLVAGVLAVPASAEAVKDRWDMAPDAVITIGEGDVPVEHVIVEDGEIPEDVIMKEIVLYGEEMATDAATSAGYSGILGWFYALWQAILRLFGL